MSAMSQKIKSFFAGNWFSLLTLMGLAISGYFSMNYATRDHARAIHELQINVSNMNVNGSQAMRDMRQQVQALTNDMTAMKDFTFKLDRKLNRMERNLDRVSWVVEEIAKKQGITPPRVLPEPETYE